MKKSKLLLSGIAVIAIFIFLLLCNSADWLLREFGQMDFSTVLYQLYSPLKGAGQGIVNQYLMECFVKTLIETAVLVWIYASVCLIRRKLSLRLTVAAFGRKRSFELFPRLRKSTKILCVLVLCGIGTGVIYNKACLVGIPQYLYKITHPSNFYEAYFVHPDTVEIAFPEKKRNLICIYLESMETTYASEDVGGGKSINYIPNLTKLAEENISFSDTAQLGGFVSAEGTAWTMGALLASTSGAPYLLPIQGNDAGEYEKILPGLTDLGDILFSEGYHNYFMCGSDASFAGRKLYFEQHGNYTIYDYFSSIDDGLIPPDYEVFWGFEDRKLYQYAQDKLEAIAALEEPFNFTLLTVDTHHPDGYLCPLCDNQFPMDYPNAIACADRQIQEFLTWITQQPWYENTTVVIVGDHASMGARFFGDLPAGYERRVYNCFLNTGYEPESLNLTNRVFYSMDLFPTVLSALGAEIDGNRLGLGTNLFSDEPTLGEQLGAAYYQTEYMKYSRYYDHCLIQGKE